MGFPIAYMFVFHIKLINRLNSSGNEALLEAAKERNLWFHCSSNLFQQVALAASIYTGEEVHAASRILTAGKVQVAFSSLGLIAHLFWV